VCAQCNTLQHAAIRCNMLQHTIICTRAGARGVISDNSASHVSYCKTRCNTRNTLQHTHEQVLEVLSAETLHHTYHTATHCNTLQHTATHCNTLQHTATHCNTLQHTATGARGAVSSNAVGSEYLQTCLCEFAYAYGVCNVLHCVAELCSVLRISSHVSL